MGSTILKGSGVYPTSDYLRACSETSVTCLDFHFGTGSLCIQHGALLLSDLKCMFVGMNLSKRDEVTSGVHARKKDREG